MFTSNIKNTVLVEIADTYCEISILSEDLLNLNESQTGACHCRLLHISMHINLNNAYDGSYKHILYCSSLNNHISKYLVRLN